MIFPPKMIKMSTRGRGRRHHHGLLMSKTTPTATTTFLLYLLYLLSLSVITPSNHPAHHLLFPPPVSGQLEGAEPLTKEAFELAFEHINVQKSEDQDSKDSKNKDQDPDQQALLFRQFFSAALLFTRFELDDLLDSDQQSNEQPLRQPLVPVSSCLIYLREYGKGLMSRDCAKKIKEQPLIDKRLRHFLLAYRCFYSSSPQDYELHTATIDRIALTPTDGWTISFRPQETYLCQVRWTVAETVQRTMAYLKEQGLLRREQLLKEGTGSLQLQEEQEVQGRGGVQELEELLLEEQLQHRPPPPLSHERFEAAFARNLRKEFHLFPFFGYLFTRDLREEGGQWTPVRQCFINLGLTPGKAIVVSRCAALIRRYQRIDPRMSNLFAVYRCFKSESPYDYELVVTPVLKLYTEQASDGGGGNSGGGPSPPSIEDFSSAASTPAHWHRNGIILFRPYSPSHCSVGLMGSRPVDALLFAHYLNDSGAVESSRIEPSSKIRKGEEGEVPVPAVAQPLTRAQFEAAFPLGSGFASRPYLSFVFVRDLESVLARTLLPLRSCQVLLYEEGRGIVSAACAEVLGHYSAIEPQGLHSLILLPYRCFYKSPQGSSQGNLRQYDLLNATISGLAMEEGQYVLRFRLKSVDDHHSSCAPVWAKDYALDELPTEVEAEERKRVKEMKTKEEEEGDDDGDASSGRRRPPSEEL